MPWPQRGIHQQVEQVFSVGTLCGLSDAELLERFVSGKAPTAESAFSALVHRHGLMVHRVCRSIVRDHHAAQDASQATFLVLALKARSLRVEPSLGPWLHRVACRIAIKARASSARRQMHESRAALMTPFLVFDDPPDDVCDLVHDEIERLPERYRTPLILCDLEGHSYEEAARLLGRPVGTIKSRLARGREQLRGRMIRRGVSPTIIAPGRFLFHPSSQSTGWANPADAISHIAVKLVAGRAAADLVPTTVLVLLDGALKMSLPRLKLALAALLLGCGVFSLPVISGQLKPDDQGKVTEAEPSLDEVREREKAKSSDSALVSALASSFAKPWESVVRVRVLSSGSVGVGSGTIIHSTANEAIILTCAHIFKIDGESHQPFERLPRRIEVDLFDGKLQGEQLAQVHYVESHPGEVIDFDFNRDVGLIRIRPGRQLPSSRVVPAHWEPQVGMKMLTLGCSEGQDATAWSTLIVNARVKALVGQPDYEAIVCQVAPKQGRTGGGLFTSDGYLAGVCNFAEPKEDHGLYATPRSIYRLLDRNNLSFLYAGSKATRSEFDELVGQAESQLVERNREEAGETLGRLNRLIDARREELQTELRSLDANYARRSDELKRRLSEVPPEPSSETVPEKDIAVPGVDLAPDPPALKDAEARLDQILEEWHRRSTNYASLDVRFTLRESTPKWGDEISGTGRLVLAEGGRALVTLDRGKGPSKNRDRIIWSDDAVHQFVSASKTHTIWPIGAGDRGRVPTLLALPFGWKLDAEKLRSRFRVELLADNPAATCLLRLTPQSPVGRGTLCKAFLELDRASYLPKRYIVISPDGHSTRDFRVLQIERDQTQPEELWRIPDDDGWKVTRPGAIEQWLFRLIKPDLVP